MHLHVAVACTGKNVVGGGTFEPKRLRPKGFIVVETKQIMERSGNVFAVQIRSIPYLVHLCTHKNRVQNVADFCLSGPEL